MIQHLNQFGFYRYGMREPERSAEDIRRSAKLSQQVKLDWEKQTVYQKEIGNSGTPDCIEQIRTKIRISCLTEA